MIEGLDDVLSGVELCEKVEVMLDDSVTVEVWVGLAPSLKIVVKLLEELGVTLDASRTEALGVILEVGVTEKLGVTEGVSDDVCVGVLDDVPVIVGVCEGVTEGVSDDVWVGVLDDVPVIVGV